ncbi:Protein of unknown function [Desulfonispora thiosulfatigenes DSM 11270]|uniref:DUF3006 domain-containing protein n=1 Tax=Desulfonispora thiosulfatigenes DSM 11270 TaxID=656914 RepID=A0A1W1VAS1_DESTI|nr:DUF3006 domain-containing protein [Desulfonispora thiosulfatigenes]SMB90300.1 Protein of unknown function [Desulfonispora thiosulfatigenes DSM 11270]
MKVIIDRFAGNYAICENENREMIDIEKNKLPVEAKEGDVLIIERNNISIDYEETAKRKLAAEKLLDDLWE